MGPSLSRIAGCALALSLLGPSLAAADSPKAQTDAELGFLGDTRDSILTHMKRVGLLPARPPAGIVVHSGVKAQLESAVAEALRKAGIEVVGHETYDASFERLSRQLGGLYDPTTGTAKTEQLRAAFDNARREFVEKEHLDAYVVVAIALEKAPFTRDFARWDGALERSDGRLPPSFIEAMKNPGTSSGTLPAYSLVLQLANPENKVVFGRKGGLQLASYFDPAHTKDGAEFLPVPGDSLFQDTKRIERAVRIATLPLLHSAEDIAAGSKDPAINGELIKLSDLPAPPPGAAPKPDSPLRVPREQILASVHRVAVTMLERGEFPVTPEISKRYMALIREQLTPLGWELGETDQGFRVLGAAVRTSGGMYDPVTGVLDTERLSQFRRSVFRYVGMAPPPDAILWVQLVRTVAEHNFGDVQWDGVSESAIDLGPVRKALLGGSRNAMVGNGAVVALSLRTQLRDANDVLLYDSRGGIQLLQQLKGKKPENLAPTELLQDATRERPAVHAALRDLVLTPEKIDAEQHPKAGAAH
jgi:hypothetical protein